MTDKTDLYKEAMKFAKEKASISYVQRKCRCSYNDAERMLEQMVSEGVIGTNNWRKGGEAIGAGGVQALSAAPSSPWSRALEIRMAQGWKLKGDRLPVLYTDTINGEGVGRDDLWLCTTKALAASPTPPAEQQANPSDAENLRRALQFYADGEHFIKSDGDAWDTVSGEPQNYWCDEAGTATVEDGSIAKLALEGHAVRFEDDDTPSPKAAQAEQQAAPKAAPVTQQAGYAEVIECGNSYAKVKLKGEAFGSARVGDIFYTALQQDEPVGEVVSASCDHATVRWLHQTSSVGGGDPRNSRAWPKVSGVSRDEGHSRALLVFFAAEPTDDEVRAVHDTLAASPTPPAEQQAAPKAAPGEPDGFGSAEHWKEKAQYWAGVAHRLRGEALRGEPVDGIVHPPAPQQEAQEPAAWQGVHDQTDLYYTKPAQADVRPLYTAPQPAPVVGRMSPSKEWLETRLAIADDSDVQAGVPSKNARPCDAPPGCDSHNCHGCDDFKHPSPTPQPAPAPLSEMPYEKRKAIQEGEQISASDAWFKARHEMLDTVDRRNVFRAGFDRGWSAALAAQGGK